MFVCGAVLMLVAGCGKGAVSPGAGGAASSTSPTQSAIVILSPSSPPSGPPSPSPSPSASLSPAIPFFETPEAAGLYLADIWNAKDDAALHHITNDDSRASLADMRTFAKDLKLDSCSKNADKTYTCVFSHGFLPGKSDPGSVPTSSTHDGPAATGDPHHGHTALKGVAVSKTGWYFNVFLYCG
ncbi:MAG: hypothetical protein QOC60_1738 [Frankiaceae bacterium]|nr:hypothetical protein [Frankiaceae bacterium]